MDRCAVLLSTYNGQKYLPELLDSVFNQNNVDVSVIVRDDGSSDDTLKILEHYKKSNKLIFYKGDNLKPAKSFLDLIHHVEPEFDYYAFCDQDDVWDKEKLFSAVRKIKSFPENQSVPVLYNCAVEVVDSDLNSIKTVFHNNENMTPLYDLMMQGTPGCTYVFNKELLLQLKKYRPEIVSMHDSWVCYVCIAIGGVFLSENKPLIKYRQHSANVIGGQRKSFKDTVKKITRGLEIKNSDMCTELIKGYGSDMTPEIRRSFDVFLNYKHSLKKKWELLCLTNQKEKNSGKAFIKAKMMILFNSL